MKSFLLGPNNKPVVRWGQLKNNTFYEGVVPENYSLAVSPTNEKMVIVDIDCKKEKENGYNNIPKDVFKEMLESFHYKTKSGGMHVFLNYTGDKVLKNCATKLAIDLRIGPNEKTKNSGGYVKYYHSTDIRECIHLIKPTSPLLNNFLEQLFS